MNNPIMYADPSGHWIETVFDLISLGASVVEVVINPANPGLGQVLLEML